MTKAEALAAGVHPSDILKMEVQGKFPAATDYHSSVVTLNEDEFVATQRATTYEIHDISVGNAE